MYPSRTAAVIVKEKTVLLLQRKEDEETYPGLWEFPSGKRRFNETSIEALLREVKEETGLSVVVKRPISVFEYVVETLTEIRDTTQINFLVEFSSTSESVQINKEELLFLQSISEETRKCALMALETQS